MRVCISEDACKRISVPTYRRRSMNIDEESKKKEFSNFLYRCYLHFASIFNKELLKWIIHWFHSSTVDVETSSLVATPEIHRQLLRFSSASVRCGYLPLPLSIFHLSFLPSLPPSFSVVSRTPLRITKTNSPLVVWCNLRKTRATVSEHGPTSLQFLTYTYTAL